MRRVCRWRITPGTVALLVVALLALGGPAQAQDGVFPAQDRRLITPTTQGTVGLPHSELTLTIAYATVRAPAHLRVTRAADGAIMLEAAAVDGMPLARFEMPLVIAYESDAGPVEHVVGWPGPLSDAPAVTAAPDAAWLVVFDAHGVYARPADSPAASSLYLGPLAHFSFDLVRVRPAMDGSITHNGRRYLAAPPRERAIQVDPTSSTNGDTLILPTAARDPRYRDRFAPEDLRNPGGLMLLGLVETRDLPDVTRALAGRIPDDPDIPAPGAPRAPLSLFLPFDCSADWVVSWGYHHSTPQNRFAVDFAARAPGGAAGQAVYAAHAGALSLKRVGMAEHPVATGITARVLAADGITSTVYGHLAEADTRALWDLAPDDLPPFEWVPVGPVDAGRAIGVAGATGYATGPHVHFALWSWDQSLYQPVPLGPLDRFERGMPIPRDLRADCAAYRW